MPRYPVRPAEPGLSATGGVTAVDRALTLLSAFGEGDRTLSLAELSARSGLVSSTTLRLLASLIHFRLVQRTPQGRYALGAAVARLHRLYAASFSLDEIVPPAMRKLVAATRESASFHVRQGDQRLVLYRVNSPQALSDQSHAGDLLTLDRGAGGHVLMAFEGAAGRRYDRIRKDGFVAMPASDRLPELAGISAPVFGGGGELVGALTLTVPSHRYKAAHVPLVRSAAARLTAQLAGADPEAG